MQKEGDEECFHLFHIRDIFLGNDRTGNIGIGCVGIGNIKMKFLHISRVPTVNHIFNSGCIQCSCAFYTLVAYNNIVGEIKGVEIGSFNITTGRNLPICAITYDTSTSFINIEYY
jgi:hypothetical protein